MGNDTSFPIFFDPAHLSRWLEEGDSERRLAQIDFVDSRQEGNQLMLSLKAIVKSKPHFGGTIGARSGFVSIHARKGRILDSTSFDTSTSVESNITQKNDLKNKVSLSPKFKAGSEAEIEVGGISVGSQIERESAISFSYSEREIQRVASENHVQWYFASPTGVHPFRDYLLLELPVGAVMNFEKVEKRGSLSIRLTSPDYFNSKGEVKSKATAILACFVSKVRWKDSMTFWIE